MTEAKGTPWNDKEIQRLKQLAGQFSAVYISTQIEGRSTEATRKQIRKLGLKGFVSVPPKPHPAAPKLLQAPVRVKTYVEPRPGIRQAPKPKVTESYPPAELCPVHGCLVSNWAEHTMRLGYTCQRPTA